MANNFRFPALTSPEGTREGHMAQLQTLVNRVRSQRSIPVSSEALQPWVEYLKRLTEPDRSILIHDLKVVVGLEV